MIELVYSPDWFYGKDIIIDLVSVFVLSLIAFFSIRYFLIEKEKKNYLLLGISFTLLALSFVFKIIMNFTIYYKVLETTKVGLITLTYSALKSTDLLFVTGFLMHRLLVLFGLFMLYCIYSKQSKANIFLISYLILISIYFGRSAYYIFHITALILLIAITWNYFSNYRTTKQGNSKWLFFSFSLITLSQLVFVFVNINLTLYVFAEIIQLIGYVGLLITFIKVLKYGKKKRKK